ncbi:Copper chaperone CopZ [Sulfobacillus thermosulfidooxidans DSM 9293]|uniref:Copper chaperone CopZ n=1 Tax=Sulfobacillus thermosulfidooxidans (strain DSM 9293 / VKM B-1269 / AT-1) TaxID=929705 RepID=A0A1W1WH34_SULTA|nr:cation transporter [Sulfobacillus thermosulfidooxidans]SMC05360.1 Copper chaperone CopZ [Sulfobacillus thermosulfidooxidans DSM 9293]
MLTYDLKITGMHCVDCAHKVEAALQAVPGVTAAHVHYLKRRAQVTVENPTIVVDHLRQAVQAAGYDATPG